MTLQAETSSVSLSRMHASVFVTDPERFEALYRDNVHFVWRNLSRLGIPRDEVEDVCQEVFATVHRTRDRFEGRAGVRSWLYGIVRRVASRHRRTFHRRRRRHEAYADLPDIEVHEPAVAHGLLAERLQGFLDALDEDKRDVFILAELEELTANEISRRLGVKPNTIYSRLRAARIAFEARFGPLPRQRDSVRAAHRAEAPTQEQEQRGWVVLLGLPEGGGGWSAPSTAWLSSKLLLLGGIAVATILSVAIMIGDLQAGEAEGIEPRSTNAVGRAQTPRAASLAGVAQAAVTSASDAALPPAATKSERATLPEQETRREHATPPERVTKSERATRPEPAKKSGGAPLPEPASPPEDEALPEPAAPMPIDARRRPSVPAPPIRSALPTTTAVPDMRQSRIGRPPPPDRVDPPPPTDLLSAEELELLTEARRALDDGVPGRALAKLRQHARRFPDSNLALERAASTAEAYCALARPHAAKPHLQLLERRNRRELANRIRSRCPAD